MHAQLYSAAPKILQTQKLQAFKLPLIVWKYVKLDKT